MTLYFVMNYRDTLLPDDIVKSASSDKPHLVVSLKGKEYKLVESFADFKKAHCCYNKLVKARDGTK